MLSRVLLAAIFPLVYALSLLVPKRDNLWVFGAWFGHRYDDSPRAMFEACHRQPGLEVEAVWIYKGDRPVCPDIPDRSVVHCYSIRGIALQLRARVFVICVNSLDVFFGCITVRNFVVQTWHGTPMKSIGYPLLKGRPFALLRFWIRRLLTENYSMVISPQAFTDEVFSRAFHLPQERMFRSAYPRCDSLLLEAAVRDEIRRTVLGAQPDEFVWLYMPTHRDEGQSGDGTLAALNGVCSAAESANTVAKVFFKPHFYENRYFDQWPGTSSVSLLASFQRYSLYEVIGSCDGLITDYSSVAYDVEITGMPILIFESDIAEYKLRNRELLRLPSDDFSNRASTVDELAEMLAHLSVRKAAEGQDFIPDRSSNVIIAEVRKRLEI